jgi:hypothetical protein
MRVSLLAANHWVSSKTFNASPAIYGDGSFKNISTSNFYWLPLDTMITEER